MKAPIDSQLSSKGHRNVIEFTEDTPFEVHFDFPAVENLEIEGFISCFQAGTHISQDESTSFKFLMYELYTKLTLDPIDI